MTEEELQALRQGDQALFAALVKQHHHALIAIATPIVGTSEAEEVVQASWLKAFQAISNFEGRSHIRTWLTRIVINEARMQLRKTKREHLFSEYEGDDDEDYLGDRFKADGHWDKAPARWDLDSPEDLLITAALADCLDRLLSGMPANQRAVLELRDSGGISFDEICNELSLSASNARVILHRARTQLFRLVDHFQETGEC